jgi:hypothetical protein
MPAKAPCAEVAEEVKAQGKIVRVSKLMSELAAATRAPPPTDPKEQNFDEAAWQIASKKPGWQKYALNVVRGALKNIREQKTREARAELTTKVSAKTERAWRRIAERTMKKAAEEFAKASVEKSEKPAEPRRRRTHVASSR